MKRFKKILCYVGGPADPSPGLNKAVDLAERNGASLTLMDVLPESTEGPWLIVPGKPELEEMVVTSRIQELEDIALNLRERALQVDIVVTTGNPFFELIRRVISDEHDLVIKTAQGLESRLGGLLGTTALHLMRKCPAPVWVVKPPSAEPFNRVLAAVDPKPDLPGEDPLSIKVLQLAASLAEANRSELHVVHAWWLHSEAMLRGRRINMPPAEIDGLLREVRQAAEQSLDALVQRIDLGKVPHQIHIVKGQPYEVISGMASKSDITVMGTLSRSGVDGLLIGNTAERILRRVECSVLAIKPEGFKTPLHFEEAAAALQV
jgi:universal stress protein E